MSSDLKNVVIAISLTIAIILGWQFFYESPRLKEKESRTKEVRETDIKIKKEVGTKIEESFFDDRDKALKSRTGDRIKINTPKLSGSISLLGARFDDLILSQYKLTLDKDSDSVELLSPAKHKQAYFAEFGWVCDDNSIELPTSQTIWMSDKTILRENDTVTLSWKNSKGIIFYIDIALDDDYMFTVTQRVKNNSIYTIHLKNYGLINRLFDSSAKQSNRSHEGLSGVFNKVLKEVTYKDLKEDKSMVFDGNSGGSWLGVSDQYWLTALVPSMSPGEKFDTKFQYVPQKDRSKFQIDYMFEQQTLYPGDIGNRRTYFFTGAKVLSSLELYEKKYDISLFDRSIDFGWFYFITKPLFHVLKYFYDLVGNFGVSILIVTVIMKLLLFPLANKSYKSMNKMKRLQPEIDKIRERYADDKVKQNQAVFALYKKEKASPLSGCLPLLVQIPIFFSLYKVLFITIEMRHAGFFGWIKDLSATDPTTLFNLFGLIPWDPPSFLMIGAWPIIMAITMFIQQSFSPEPADPTQAKVMKFLPLIFLFMFASFPAGLVIYWTWSNVLSIAQQYTMKYIYGKEIPVNNN